MPIVTEWNFVNAEQYSETINGFNDVVKLIRFEVYAFDAADPKGIRGKSYGEVALPLPTKETTFLAANQITTAVLLDWAQDALKKEIGQTINETSPRSAFARYEAQALINYNLQAKPAFVPFIPVDVAP